MSNNIIDKIQLSGITYDIVGQGGSGVSVVEVTQAEYDALPSSAKTDTSKMYVITDAEAGDLTNYYTKTETNTLLGGKANTATTYTKQEVDNAITAATSTKQDTLTAGTGIDITDNVISVTGGGSVTIDSSFDRNSENAISNKVVSRGTIGSYGLVSEGSGENLKNIIQAYDQGGHGISDKNLVYTNINNKPVISIYSNKNNVPYNIEVVETSAITTAVTSSSTDSEIPSAKAVYDALGSAGGGISSAECQTMIDNSISGKADSDNVYTTGQTSGATELATAFAATQPKLSAGTGISIDANNVISATGGGGGGSSYTAGDGIDITNNVISVTGKADTSAVTAIQDSLSGYVTTDTRQEITGNKTFIGSSDASKKPIIFKQANNNHKIGFVCQNTASTNNELATFEFRPNTFTVDGVQHPLLYLGHYRSTNTANAGVPQTVIGFRQYDQKNGAAYHYLMPLPEKAKTPFSLTTSFKDYYAPMGFKVDSGGTMVTTDNTGVVDLSSYLGGGGKAIEAGRGIDVTTDTTADTVSFNLPMSADTIGLAFFNSKDGGEISSGNSINENNLVLSGLYNKIGGNGSKRVFSGNFISGWSSKIYDNTWAYDYGATYNIIFGSYNTLSGNGKSVHSSIIVGDYCYGYDKNQSLFGLYLQAQNNSEHSIGQNNVSNKASSTFGDSGNTLFSVGNGTEENARHNAFEIRQNGDIYLSSGGTDIKLQDHLGGGGASYSAGTGIDITNDVISVSGVVMSSAITTSVTSSSTDAQVPSAKAVNDKLGGLSLVKLTQAQYDALATKDSNTLYVIVN